tara:strand:+ start:10127 stop:10459 length:333 start_codon:yes stop_codon:yes gene_type:complete
MEMKRKHGGVVLDLTVSYHQAYPEMEATVILYERDWVAPKRKGDRYQYAGKYKWVVGTVQVPPEHFPENGFVRTFISKALYTAITEQGYVIPKTLTAIGNIIVEKSNGNI